MLFLLWECSSLPLRSGLLLSGISSSHRNPDVLFWEHFRHLRFMTCTNISPTSALSWWTVRPAAAGTWLTLVTQAGPYRCQQVAEKTLSTSVLSPEGARGPAGKALASRGHFCSFTATLLNDPANAGSEPLLGARGWLDAGEMLIQDMVPHPGAPRLVRHMQVKKSVRKLTPETEAKIRTRTKLVLGEHVNLCSQNF